MSELKNRIKTEVRIHLFASVPENYQTLIKKSMYFFNLMRLTLESIVMIVMNGVVLAAYTAYYLRSGTRNIPHLSILVSAILISLAFINYFRRCIRVKRYPTSLIAQNIVLIFNVVHYCCELAIFAFGPKDIAAFIRFCAVPFILGSIPIIKQKSIFILNLVVFIINSVYVFAISPYPVPTSTYSIVANIWLNAFICSLLVSFLVFSGYVNNFLAEMRLKEQSEQLDRLSKQDQLTGISNRRKLMSFLDETWEEAASTGSVVTAMMLDIDFFKEYNDCFGHAAGDTCLVVVSEAIQKRVNLQTSIVARYGGEEFAVVIYGRPHEAMVSLADQIRVDIENLQMENPNSVINPYLTVSIGVFTCNVGDYVSAQRIIEMSDEALFQAKRSGRNRIIHTKSGSNDFMDLFGQSLSMKSPMKDRRSHYADSYLDMMMRESGNNCFFAYFENEDGTFTMAFSKMAVELYELPQIIYKATLSSLSDYAVDGSKAGLKIRLEEGASRGLSNLSIKTSFPTRQSDNKLVSVELKCTYRSDGVLRFAIGGIVDLEQIKQYNKFIQHESMLNSITRLPNRKRFAADMAQLLKTPGQGFVVLLDVIRFKLINSIYNHNIGDQVLQEVACILKRLTADDGRIYSNTVDQFVVMMPHTTQESVLNYMERIDRYFEAHLVKLNGMEMNINMAMAAIEYGATQSSFDEIMVDLDITVQKAKAPDNKNYLFFSKVDRERYLRDVTLEQQLSNAIKEGFAGFFLHYQPIVAAAGSKIIGAEVLLRWCSKDGEIVPPLTIIPILEKNGLMSKIEPWIFKQACSQCKLWLTSRNEEDFFVQINLSPSQVFRASLISELRKAVENSEILYKNIVLEVTESSLMIDMKAAIKVLRQLKALGVRIAVDDFGTGYSSLSYLRNLPVDEIKIDRSFLMNIINDHVARVFLKSIVDLSKSMGYTVCMEGVETDAQLDFLNNLPFDFYQGYLFSRPVDPAEFDK